MNICVKYKNIVLSPTRYGRSFLFMIMRTYSTKDTGYTLTVNQNDHEEFQKVYILHVFFSA